MTSFATTDDDVSRFTAGVHHVTESLAVSQLQAPLVQVVQPLTSS